MKIQNTKTGFSQNRSPVTYGVFANDGSIPRLLKYFHQFIVCWFFSSLIGS